MKYSDFLTKQNISIGLIWLFHLSGIIGIIYTDESWFIKATPLNLLISFILLIIKDIFNFLEMIEFPIVITNSGRNSGLPYILSRVLSIQLIM